MMNESSFFCKKKVFINDTSFHKINMVNHVPNRASGEDVRLMLWDTAGQEEFNAITKAYYRGAQVGFIGLC